jgi:hypothetical protein
VHRGKRNAYRIYWKPQREETTTETTALMVEQYQIRDDLDSTSSGKESVAGYVNAIIYLHKRLKTVKHTRSPSQEELSFMQLDKFLFDGDG